MFVGTPARPEGTSATYVSAIEMCRRTGASYRQLDYWIRTHVIPLDDATPGSGNRRRMPMWMVPRIRLMTNVAVAFMGMSPGEILARVFANYEDGHLDMGGWQMTWEVEHE